jgi:FkbM family methyltransferase
MKLTILDLGANDGCSIIKFQKMLKEKHIEDYCIYSFEPHPYFLEKLKTFESNNVHIVPKIGHTHNGIAKLFVSSIGNDGSSIYADKTTNGVSEGKYIDCETVDMAAFIKELPPHDELWVKMDVEGAEYELIPHLHTNHIIPKIRKLFIEWHHEKIASITTEQHNRVVKMVEGLEKHDWCALAYRTMNDEDYRGKLDAFVTRSANRV